MTKDETIEPSLAESPTNEAIEAAIKTTDYKYFGDYPFSDGQHDAVGVLCAAGRALIRSRATGGGTSPDYVMVPRWLVEGWANSIETDATPAQVGPSAETLRELLSVTNVI